MELVAPDPRGWRARFGDEAAVVRRRLGGSTPVEHVGSTAVPIEGKDVVDVLVGVDPAGHARAVADLAGGTFVLDGERTTAEGECHAWLARLVDGERVTVVHVVVAGGAEWRRRTAFRDALRRNDALRREYVPLKRAVAAETGDWGECTAGKASFVARVLRAAGAATGPAGDGAARRGTVGTPG